MDPCCNCIGHLITFLCWSRCKWLHYHFIWHFTINSNVNKYKNVTIGSRECSTWQLIINYHFEESSSMNQWSSKVNKTYVRFINKIYFRCYNSVKLFASCVGTTLNHTVIWTFTNGRTYDRLCYWKFWILSYTQ